MMTAKIPFAGKELSLPLPDGWKVVDTVRPVSHAKLTHVSASLWMRWIVRFGTKGPLRDMQPEPEERLCCAWRTSAGRRPTAQYFGAVLDYLLAHGAMPENMLVVFGLGVHRDMTARRRTTNWAT